MAPGKLFLLPNVLGEEGLGALPALLQDLVPQLGGLIVESEKEGRRYLKMFSFPEGRSFRDVPLRLLSEHTTSDEVKVLLEPLLRGEKWGLISDAGLPCLADPGSNLVALARKAGIEVEAIGGPSAIVLALMLSGLSAQKFCFHGYLERDPSKLRTAIKALESEGITQVFIEAPYRSQSLLTALLEVLEAETLLSCSTCLGLPESSTWTLRVKEWKKKALPDLHKKPAVFLIKKL